MPMRRRTLTVQTATRIPRNTSRISPSAIALSPGFACSEHKPRRRKTG
jgi:hypothetical protein